MNPGAGNAAEIDDALRRAGAFDIIRVAPHRMTQAARDAIDRGATRLLAVGGDGSVSAVAAAVARTDVELAVVPAGTFNHFARDHGIPTDHRAACEVAHSGRVVRADVAWVNERLFLNTSSVGVYANNVRVRARWGPRGGGRTDLSGGGRDGGLCADTAWCSGSICPTSADRTPISWRHPKGTVQKGTVPFSLATSEETGQ